MAIRNFTLGVALLASSSGCLVEEPPDLHDPQRTRPFIIVGQVIPALSRYQKIEILQGATRGVFEATIPIQSEDLGERLGVAVHQDIGAQSYRWLSSRTDVAPSTMADGPRDVILPPVDLQDYGCHYVTAIVAHESSFNTGPQDHFVQEKFESDASTITWTVNVFGVNSGGVNENVLTDCPDPDPARGAM